jgi:copper transport protein
VNAVPARAEAALPVERTLEAEQVVVDLVVMPARTGVNEFHFYALEPSGGPLDVESLAATMALPAEGIGPVDVPISPIPLGPGHYMARAAEIEQPGTWRLEVTIVLRTGETVTLASDIPVR